MSGKLSQTVFARLEILFLFVLIGTVLPILLFLAGWWGAYFFAPEKYIVLYMLSGLILGLLLDIFFLKKWVKSAYQIRLLILVLIYLFYSVGIFGFLMGFPLFNLFMGPLAGFYSGRRLLHAGLNIQQAKKIFALVNLFTAFVLAMACLAALILAASETTLAGNINGMFAGMFNLHTNFSNQSIIGFSIFAGIVLVVMEYLATGAAAKFAFGQ